jgi:hypothetical protein
MRNEQYKENKISQTQHKLKLPPLSSQNGISHSKYSTYFDLSSTRGSFRARAKHRVLALKPKLCVE